MKNNRINLTRNVGQHPAIAAVLITLLAILLLLDCDLQDDPKYIPKLVEKLKMGAISFNDKRYSSSFIPRNLFGSLFYKVFNSLINDNFLRIDENIGSYSSYRNVRTWHIER